MTRTRTHHARRRHVTSYGSTDLGAAINAAVARVAEGDLPESEMMLQMDIVDNAVRALEERIESLEGLVERLEDITDDLRQTPSASHASPPSRG
ncbi:hypothetical protein ACFVBP_10755 [Nocardioides sp. NPDC057764]|uniref:hypothetical protein n=1 Tax=Nocardioides sp. NPDC057764 TaxID=3346243 RepID=UPI0036710A54